MAKGNVLLFLPLLLVLFRPAPVAAQASTLGPDVMDMSLEDLMKVEIDSVYGASGYKQKVTEAPASITIVTADEIQRYGYRTLADILRNVTGFYVTNDRNYTYLGIRGFGRSGDYNSRFLLMVDGHRTNGNIYAEALIGTEFPVDIDLIDRVEVIRGPNSSLYVASAFLAVVNVITKTARKQDGINLSGEAGSQSTYKSRVTFGHQFRNGLAMTTSGTYYNSAGQQRIFFPEFNDPATNFGVAEGVDGDRAQQLFGTVSFKNFQLEGAYGSRTKHIPTASFDTIFNSHDTRTVDSRGYLDLSYNHKFGSDWGFMARAYYDRAHYDGLYPHSGDDDPSAVIVNRDAADGQWWGAKAAVSKTLFDEQQTVIVGVEYENHFQMDQTNYDVEPRFVHFDSHPDSHFTSVFAQDEVHLRSNLTLALGLRHDRYSTFGGTTNPRVALIYQPFEMTTVKLLYGQAFRPPNAYELYYAIEGVEGNPKLQPERVKTMEAVVEQYLRNGFRISLSGYFYPIRDLISQEVDAANGNLVFQNGRRVDMKGAEVGLKRQWRSGLETGVSVNMQATNAVGSSGDLTNSPALSGQGSLSVPLFRSKFFASANVTYVSRRLTRSGDYTKAYFLPDVTFLSRSFRRWTLSASLYNVFNQQYFDPPSIGNTQHLIPQNGRSFRVKLTFHP